MLTLTLIAAVISLLLTLGVFWVNPHRFSNQAFALVSIIQTVWLGCVHRAMQAGANTEGEGATEVEFWFRANAAVIAYLPAGIWLLQAAITASYGDRSKVLLRSLPLFLLSTIAAVLTYTNSFVTQASSDLLIRGYYYYIYSGLGVLVFSICIFNIFEKLKTATGVRRVELQFLGLNSVGTAIALALLNSLGNFLNLRILNRSSILVLILTSALTAWALLFHRVFNAREVLLQITQRGSFILALSIGTYALWQVAHIIIAEPFGLLLSIGVCGSAAVWLDRKSRQWFERGNLRKLQRMRQSAIDYSSSEVRTDALVARLEGILHAEYQTRFAVLLFDHGDSFDGQKIALIKKRPGCRLLLAEGWTTPESILRRKPTPALEDLQQLLEKHAFGVMVTAPHISPAPSMILALGVRHDESPFTYPEVERLQIIAELFNNLVTRSRLASQAAMQARIEYLAMASRGLAHDLKNLITPVSTFLVHTDKMFPRNSTEAEVHSTASQAMRVITEYVRESLFFAEKLTPRFESIDVLALLATVRDLVHGRAIEQGISITIAAFSNATLSGDKVLLQRMLMNLLTNALEASQPSTAITMGFATPRAGWIQITVADQGSGISQENIGRIFDPYFTTRDFGNDCRGFGLGLTIVQKIVLLHHGQISVHSEDGSGTRFTIDLPAEPKPFSGAQRAA